MFETARTAYNDAYLNSTFRTNLNRIILEARKTIKPPLNIKVSEWADQNRILPETSAGHGKWRTPKLPHSKKIMDCVNDPRIRKISLMGSSQIGKTEIMNNIIGYFIDIDPCYIMVMQPTDKDAKDYADQKLDQMIQDTRCLRKKVAKKKKRDKENSTLRKRFLGGFLTIVSGNSTSATRQRSARVTFGDDIDAIEIGHTKEGDPVSRLIARSTTFKHDSLNVNISTPTLNDASRIQALYNESCMYKYYVKCPHCGHQQILKPENITWDKEYDAFGKVIAQYADSAKYACESCAVLITEGERLEMLKDGEWIADRPQIVDHAGFWINEISSTLSSLPQIARKIIAAGDDPDKLEPLYNTVFGLPYRKVQGTATDPMALMERVEDYINIDNPRLPNGVLALTASVDVQRGGGLKEARLEVKLVGWGLNRENWVCFLYKIPGNIKQKEVWDKLDEFREREWFRKDGVKVKLWRTFVDAGFESQTVYDYVRGRQHEGLFAIKGARNYGAPLLPRKVSMVDKGRVPLITIGTQFAKQEIYSCLNEVKEPGAKYTHFTKAFCNSEYFQQLTAEHAVRKRIGYTEYIFYEKKKRTDANEALDLMVYNYAAFRHMNVNMERLKKILDSQAEELQKEKEETPEAEQPVAARPAERSRRRRNTGRNSSIWGFRDSI